MYTRKKIKKGTVVVRFGGYVMTLEEERKLPLEIRDVAHQIDDNHVIGIRKVKDIQLVDRINHSCSPNTGFKGQIFLVAMRDIQAGEEIVFDYAMVLGKKTRYNIACSCHSKECRGAIKAEDWKKKDLQEKYKGYFQWYIQEKIEKNDL